MNHLEIKIQSYVEQEEKTTINLNSRKSTIRIMITHKVIYNLIQLKIGKKKKHNNIQIGNRLKQGTIEQTNFKI
jgi:hypothetical protein